MSPPLRATVAVLALLAIVGGSVAVVAQPGGPFTGASGDVSAAGTTNTSTTMAIELGESGDAHWNVSMDAALPDQAAVDSFEDLAASFEANESDVLTTATFRRYVQLADNSTSRDMDLTDVERTATLSNDSGRLNLSFTWENFGLRDDSTIRVADAFTGPDGLWLQGLSADQRLVVSVSESFDITSAPKGYTNRTIKWDGPTTFDPGDFEITYDIDPSSPTTTAPDPTTSTRSTPSTSPSTTQPTTAGAGATTDGAIPLLAIVVVSLVALAVGAYLVRNREDIPIPHPAADGNGATAGSTDDDQRGAQTTTAADVDSGAAAPEADEATAPPPLDRELLSDEEYVEALLAHNDGRMKQANIVTETGWSNAKVSQLLSEMAREGRVEKLRIGRENLISFPEDGESED